MTRVEVVEQVTVGGLPLVSQPARPPEPPAFYVLREVGDAGPHGTLVYVEVPGRAEVDVLAVGAGLSTAYRVPGAAVELVTADDAVSLVLDMIRDVPLAARTRRELAQALAVDETDVGRVVRR